MGKKYDFPFPETIEAFNAKILEAGLDRNVNISINVDNKLKPLPYDVKKTSPIEKHKTNDDVNIIINEEVFEKLPPDLQELMIAEALAYISYDFEKDVTVITKHDFTAHTMVLSKYNDGVIRLRESTKSILQAAKQAEDEAKALTKKAGSKNF